MSREHDPLEGVGVGCGVWGDPLVLSEVLQRVMTWALRLAEREVSDGESLTD